MQLHFDSTATEDQVSFLRKLKVRSDLIERIKARDVATADLCIELVLAEKERAKQKLMDQRRAYLLQKIKR